MTGLASVLASSSNFLGPFHPRSWLIDAWSWHADLSIEVDATLWRHCEHVDFNASMH